MYSEMKKLFHKTRFDVFTMSVAYLLDVGFRQVNALEESDFENVQGNGLMSREFLINIMQVAQKIAKICGNNVTEVIQFCAAESIFETRFYAEKLERDCVVELLKGAIEYIQNEYPRHFEEMAQIIELEDEEMELLNGEV